MRHSYATAALAAGIPAKVVSERLGHATIAITLDVYSHVIPGMDAQAANAVASLILDGFRSADSPPTQCYRLPLIPGRSRPVPLPILLPLQAPFDLLRPLVERP